ncbi:uncharacterized protein TNCV_4949021 [Trichonephila clavipes]|nr:uncharacterized protein TNCV_4949021 [Trichonephila clavipes]
MFTRKELGLDLPYRDHLLSQTLFLELFQHNLVSADGEIKGTSEEFNKYRSILARRYAERTAILYEMRVGIDIFSLDSLSTSQFVQGAIEVSYYIQR